MPQLMRHGGPSAPWVTAKADHCGGDVPVDHRGALPRDLGDENELTRSLAQLHHRADRVKLASEGLACPQRDLLRRGRGVSRPLAGEQRPRAQYAQLDELPKVAEPGCQDDLKPPRLLSYC